MTEVIVGKRELLAWAQAVSGRPCGKLEDLKDASVFLRLFTKIWPKLTSLKKFKWKASPRTEIETNINWDTLKSAFDELGLPPRVLDKKGIQACKFKPCYSFLVMLYFLQNLSANHDFSVDFAHPIDQDLAVFLQSAASVECLAKGGGLKLEDIPTEVVQSLGLGSTQQQQRQISTAQFSDISKIETNDSLMASNLTENDQLAPSPQKEEHISRLQQHQPSRIPAPGQIFKQPGSQPLSINIPQPQQQPITKPVPKFAKPTMSGINSDSAPPPPAIAIRQLPIFQPVAGKRDSSSSEFLFSEEHNNIIIPEDLSPDSPLINNEPPTRGAAFLQPTNSSTVGGAIAVNLPTTGAANLGPPALLSRFKDTRSSGGGSGGVQSRLSSASSVRSLSLTAGGGGGGHHHQPTRESMIETAWESQVRNVVQQSLSEIDYFESTSSSSAISLKATHCGGQLSSDGVQTELSGRKIEKLMIRALKGTKEADDLRRLLEESYERIEELEQKLKSGGGGSDDQRPSSASTTTTTISSVIWKNKQNRERGELIITKMKFDNESLQRQLEAAKREKDFVTQKYERFMRDMKSAHENELMYQRDQHHSQATAQQLLVFNERMRDHSDLTVELQRIRDEIDFEADRTREGLHSSEDDDLIEEELLRLRQLSTIQERQVRAMRESNSALQALVEKLQLNLKSEQEKVLNLHSHYSEQDRQLFGAVLQKEIVENNENESLRILARRLLDSESEMESLRLRHESEIEELKRELFLTQQKAESNIQQNQPNSHDLLQRDFDKDQLIERLKCEIQKLKRANSFLRAKELNNQRECEEEREGEEQQESGGGGEKQGNVWTPKEFVGNSADDADAHFGEFVSHLDSLRESMMTATQSGGNQQNVVHSSMERLAHLFWQLATNHSVLQQRVIKARKTIVLLHAQCTALSESLDQEKAEMREELQKISMEQKMESDSMQQTLLKERAVLTLKLNLAEDNLNTLKMQMSDGSQHTSRLLEQAFSSQSTRLSALLKSAEDGKQELNRLRLSERLSHQLVETQKSVIKLTEHLATCATYEEAIQLNKERDSILLECQMLQGQLANLPPVVSTSEERGDNDESQHKLFSREDVEGIMSESTAVLRSQLQKSQKDCDANRAKLEEVEKRMFGVQKMCKELEHEVEALRVDKQTLQNELDRALEQKAALQSSLSEQAKTGQNHIQKLETRIEELSLALKERKFVEERCAIFAKHFGGQQQQEGPFASPIRQQRCPSTLASPIELNQQPYSFVEKSQQGVSPLKSPAKFSLMPQEEAPLSPPFSPRQQNDSFSNSFAHMSPMLSATSDLFMPSSATEFSNFPVRDHSPQQQHNQEAELPNTTKFSLVNDHGESAFHIQNPFASPVRLVGENSSPLLKIENENENDVTSDFMPEHQHQVFGCGDGGGEESIGSPLARPEEEVEEEEERELETSQETVMLHLAKTLSEPSSFAFVPRVSIGAKAGGTQLDTRLTDHITSAYGAALRDDTSLATALITKPAM